MVTDNSGPAFPCLPPLDPEGGSASGYPYPREGMTLRDYFAAKAIPALLTVCKDDTRVNTTYAEHCAIRAYEVADAMLIARSA